MQTHNGKLARVKARGATHPGGTRPAEEGIASSGITFYLWRLYQHAWLVCLIFPLASLVRNPIPVWHLALGLLALVVFAASYTWLMWPVRERACGRGLASHSSSLSRFLCW